MIFTLWNDFSEYFAPKSLNSGESLSTNLSNACIRSSGERLIWATPRNNTLSYSVVNFPGNRCTSPIMQKLTCERLLKAINLWPSGAQWI